MSEYFSWPFFWKFLKFGVVGFSGVFVDFGFTSCFERDVSVLKNRY